LSNSVARETSTVFWKGVSERAQFLTADQTPWQWRRICFFRKGQFDPAVLALNKYVARTLISPGRYDYHRNVLALSVPEQNYLNSEIFRGAQGQDWLSPATAPFDRRNFEVVSDKLSTYNSGNEEGYLREKRWWYPLNYNLEYRDFEFGDETFSDDTDHGPGLVQPSGLFQTQGRRGRGDFYVLDLFIPSSEGARATYTPEATTYWHEK
jgi:hypothetical protein